MSERGSAPRFAAALSEHPDAAVAVGEVVGQLFEVLGKGPDLVVAFLSSQHSNRAQELTEIIAATLEPGALVGTTAAGIIGGCREIEGGPALSVWAAMGVGPLEAHHVRLLAAGPDIVLDGMPDVSSGRVLVLADPFSVAVERLVTGLEAGGTATAIGGLASAARRPGGNRIIVDGRAHDHGAAVVPLPMGVLDTVVSQGCRPVGTPWVVTKAQANVLVELGGRPALERVRDLVAALDEADRALLGHGLHVGLVVDESRLDFARGDFLIRAVLGLDPESGAVVIGDEAPVGTTVQFQVRDAVTADEDLRAMLRTTRGDAALLFTCTGRGSHLFGEPHHDANLVSGRVNGGAVAGMFCAGEIGPVGPRTFLHGFTASVALFSTAQR